MTGQTVGLDHLLERIGPLRRELAGHSIYESLTTLDDIRLFTERHVYAVWDFMCLLKGLQRLITCVELPWVPVGRASTRRLINEIVLEEESDVVDGVATGHFELYVRAMDEIGADTASIGRFLASLRCRVELDAALVAAGAPSGAIEFVRSTFRSLDSGRPHIVAAAFTFGREDSIPLMFRSILPIVDRHRARSGLFSAYLERHLLLDEEDHGPKAVEMVCELCGDDPVAWQEATRSAEDALRARLRFWDAILADVRQAVRVGAAAPADTDALAA